MKTGKTSRLWKLMCVSAAMLLAFGCEKPGPVDPNDGPNDNPTPTPPVEKTGYDIILKAESKFYEVEFPETAEAGETVTVTVTPVENVFIDGVLYNDEEAEKAEENQYTFEMPEEDVTLSILSSSTVTVELGDYFKKAVADKEIAAVGETVTVTFVTLYMEDYVNKVLVNGSIEAKMNMDESDLGWYVYTFEMPEGPAHVKGYLENEYYVIEREADEHSDVWMLDCINHQGTPEEFCSQSEGKIVHFLYKWDIGYEAECKLIGQETGTDYSGELFWSLAADNHLYQDCWAFFMPDEPVLIKVTSHEESVYPGAAYTGGYKGYEMVLGENRILTSTEPALNVELRESAAYIVTSNDYMSYDFSGLYTVTDGKISYDPENCRGDFALSGQLLTGDFAFFIVDDLLDNKADNRRYYLAGKNDFSYVCATDTEYATRFLVEADCNGAKTWYFVEKDTKSIKEATAEFKSGSSLAETCEAIISLDDNPYLKYTYETGSAPVFQYCGKEAGTYTSDKGETLVLDGFGYGSYNGTEGTYTIESSVITMTDADGNELKFNVDFNAHTFSVIAETSSDLLLDPVYSTTEAWIFVESGDPYQGGRITIRFDSDYSGNYKEGYALLKITYMDMGREKEMVGSSKPYFIDEATRTVTISQVLVGTGGWSTDYKDIVLNISEDGKTLTFADSVIYSTISPYIYCYGGEWAPIYSERAE